MNHEAAYEASHLHHRQHDGSKLSALVDGVKYMRMTGWTPDVLPYPEHARISEVPLVFGASTKRNLRHALAIGTPTVSATFGAQGFHLRDCRHMLVADNLVDLAKAIKRLLTDKALWERLAKSGRERIAAAHALAMARKRFQRQIDTVLARRQKETVLIPYAGLVPKLMLATRDQIPVKSTMAIVSKGDHALLELAERRASHFPTEASAYARHDLTDGAHAIAQLDWLRTKGAEHLLFRRTAFWRPEHYSSFLERWDREHALVCSDEVCAIYRLKKFSHPEARKDIDPRRPSVGKKIANPGLRPAT